MKRNSEAGARWKASVLLFGFAVSFIAALLFGDQARAGEFTQKAPSSPEKLRLVSSFEGGNLYFAGKFRVLKLSGTYREMGRQYGRLMSVQMKEMHRELLRLYAENGVACSGMTLEDFSMRLFRLYPARFQELAGGIAETSGLSLNAVAVLNEFFDYFLDCYSRPGSGDDGHCSGIAAWGRYSGEGKLVIGRNFDFPAFYRAFDKYITIVAYNPSDASNSTAVITYPGQIGSIQAFNSHGLVLENNNGISSGDSGRYFGQRIPFMIKDLAAMLDSSTYEALDAALATSRLHYPLIYNVAYPGGASSYEMTTFEVKKRQGTGGLLIGTNHFVSPDWGPPGSEYRDGIKESKERYDNLGRLAEKHAGKIDASVMMEIMDVPRDKGGATPEDKSIYQFVAAPVDLKIWVKALTYSDWTEVDLKPLLHR